MASIKDQVQNVLSEGRTLVIGAQILLGFQYQALFRPRFAALPGHIKALLGFQFAAYLTEAFGKLSAAAKAVHTASLLLLALAMILLMTPAPYHRLAENGENTERFHRIGSAFVLAALVPLALGLAGDFYVVLDTQLGNVPLAMLGSATTLVGALALWFGVPLLRRRRAN